MDSHPHVGIRRERRRPYAKEALGIGYQCFDVELPTTTGQTPTAAIPPSVQPPEAHPETGIELHLEEANMLVWMGALLRSLTIMVCLLSYLAVFVFVVKGCSVLFSS